MEEKTRKKKVWLCITAAMLCKDEVCPESGEDNEDLLIYLQNPPLKY